VRTFGGLLLDADAFNSEGVNMLHHRGFIFAAALVASGLAGTAARADVIQFDVSATLTGAGGGSCSSTCTLGGQIVDLGFAHPSGRPRPVLGAGLPGVLAMLVGGLAWWRRKLTFSLMP
jgi:hypothetical protein